MHFSHMKLQHVNRAIELGLEILLRSFFLIILYASKKQVSESILICYFS